MNRGRGTLKPLVTLREKNFNKPRFPRGWGDPFDRAYSRLPDRGPTIFQREGERELGSIELTDDQPKKSLQGLT